MTTHTPDRARVAELVARTRAAQGLSPTVTDPVAIDSAGILMADWITQRRPEPHTTWPPRRQPSTAAPVLLGSRAELAPTG